MREIKIRNSCYTIGGYSFKEAYLMQKELQFKSSVMYLSDEENIDYLTLTDFIVDIECNENLHKYERKELNPKPANLTFYQADDGRLFENGEDAVEYERKLQPEEVIIQKYRQWIKETRAKNLDREKYFEALTAYYDSLPEKYKQFYSEK